MESEIKGFLIFIDNCWSIFKGDSNMAVKQQKNSKFMQPKNLSSELAHIVGKGPMPRTEVTKKLWEYIKKKKLQDPNNKRDILPDEDLKKVLKRNRVNMFEMTKLVNEHILDDEKKAPAKKSDEEKKAPAKKK